MIDEPGADRGNLPSPKAKWSWGEKPPQLYTLSALAFLTPPVGLLAPDRLSALLVIIGGLTLLTNPVSGLGPIKRQRYLYALFTLLIFTGLSILWSVGDAKPAVDGFLKLIGLTAFGTLLITYARELRDQDKRLLGRWLVPALWGACALFLFNRATDNSLAGLFAGPDAVGIPGATLLLLSWPAAGMLLWANRPYQAVCLLMAAGLIQAGHQAQGIMIAWVAGGFFAGLAAVLPRVGAGLFALLAAGTILLFPILVAQFGSMQGLIPDGKPLAGGITENLFLGAGFSPATGVTGASAILQIWHDLGIVGAVILCTLVGILAVAGCKGAPAARASKIGLLAAAFALACVVPGAWHGSWVAALFITGAFAAALSDRVRNR